MDVAAFPSLLPLGRFSLRPHASPLFSRGKFSLSPFLFSPLFLQVRLRLHTRPPERKWKENSSFPWGKAGSFLRPMHSHHCANQKVRQHILSSLLSQSLKKSLL